MLTPLTVCLAVLAALIPADNYRTPQEADQESGLLPISWSEWRNLLLIALVGAVLCIAVGYAMALKMGVFAGIDVPR